MQKNYKNSSRRPVQTGASAKDKYSGKPTGRNSGGRNGCSPAGRGRWDDGSEDRTGIRSNSSKKATGAGSRKAFDSRERENTRGWSEAGTGDWSGAGNAGANEKVRAKKSLGQHFLKDLNIARKIAYSLEGCGGDAREEIEGEEKSFAAGGNIIAGKSLQGSAGGVENHHGTNHKDRIAEDEKAGIRTAKNTIKPADRTSVSGSDSKSDSTAESGKNPCDVLEVGPGMGVLTQFLLERDDITLYAAEIDRESVDYLSAHYPALVPHLIEGDFLQLDLTALFPQGVKIIGNFPYNISSQIFFKVLENRDIVPEVVGMVQQEVAVRMAEPPGSREYGILSVLLQAWYDIEYLFTVNESVFDPPPKVKSAVIRLRRNGVEQLGCDEKLFFRVVKASFGQRRKMLRNSLKAVFGDFGGEGHRFFTMRAEQLGVDDFVELTHWVAERI